jgi:hypothetical protein
MKHMIIIYMKGRVLKKVLLLPNKFCDLRN